MSVTDLTTGNDHMVIPEVDIIAEHALKILSSQAHTVCAMFHFITLSIFQLMKAKEGADMPCQNIQASDKNGTFY